MTVSRPPSVINPKEGENFLRMDLVDGTILELVCFHTPLTTVKMNLIGAEIARRHGLEIIPSLEIAVKDQLSIAELPGFSCSLKPDGGHHQELEMLYRGIRVVCDPKIDARQLHIRLRGDGDVLGRLVELAPAFKM